MKIHEYQGKEIIRKFGVTVPRGIPCMSVEEAVKAARRTIEALSLLIVAYGHAQSMHPTPNDQYDDLTIYWGQFLNTLMGKVKDVI